MRERKYDYEQAKRVKFLSVSKLSITIPENLNKYIKFSIKNMK